MNRFALFATLLVSHPVSAQSGRPPPSLPTSESLASEGTGLVLGTVAASTGTALFGPAAGIAAGVAAEKAGSSLGAAAGRQMDRAFMTPQPVQSTSPSLNQQVMSEAGAVAHGEAGSMIGSAGKGLSGSVAAGYVLGKVGSAVGTAAGRQMDQVFDKKKRSSTVLSHSALIGTDPIERTRNSLPEPSSAPTETTRGRGGSTGGLR